MRPPIPIDPQGLVALEVLSAHPLRGFDAIHLASGLRLRETLEQQGTLDETLSSTYVTSDDRLVTAAQAEALTVANPFWHIDLDTPPSS